MGVCLIAAKSSGWLDLEFWFGVFMAVAALGVVIFVHELGHFVVAKLCGVKCLKFYVGFDPPLKFSIGKYTLRLPSAIWKRQWGETEYGIGIIPLGGYVRMLGQDDNPTHADESPVINPGDGATPAVTPQLDPRNYQSKSVPQRMAIISAGVIMNVIFAFIFALVAVYLGVKYTPCVVAHTQPGDPAWRQGVLPLDKIVEINGVKHPRFTDLQQQVLLSDAAEGLKVVIQRPGQEEFIHLTLKPDNDYVSPKELPRLGVAMESSLKLNDTMPTLPGTVAYTLPESSGFKGGDTIVAVAGTAVPNSIVLEELQVRNVDQPLEFTVERNTGGDKSAKEQVKITVPANPWRELGLTMKMGDITAVRENSPATNAKNAQVKDGIKKGDKIVAIDGQPVGDPMTLPMRLRKEHKEGKEVTVTVERRGTSASPEKLDFKTTLDVPTWDSQSPAADSPAALLALGVTYNVEARVMEPPTGPAAGKGIEVGDEVVKFSLVPQKDPQTDDEKEAATFAEKTQAVKFTPDKPAWPMLMSSIQRLNPQTGIQLTVKGDKGERPVVLYAAASKEFHDPDRGLVMQPMLKPLVVHSFGEAVVFAGRETKGALMQVVLFLKKMTSGRVSITAVGGPITIFRVAAHFAREGLGSLLLFLTMLSANLAVLNFLPIPILDGGHMVFLAWEGVFGKPMPRRLADPLLWVGASLLLSLMVLTTFLDVQRLFN